MSYHNEKLIDFVKNVCVERGIFIEDEHIEIAEAIVKECINVLESRKIGNPHYKCMHNEDVVANQEAILKHFSITGIEIPPLV